MAASEQREAETVSDNNDFHLGFIPPEQLRELSNSFDDIIDDHFTNAFANEETITIELIAPRENVTDFVAKYHAAMSGDLDGLMTVSQFVHFLVELMEQFLEDD